MVWSKTLAFPMLCCFASPLTNTVHVGPKRKPKVRNGTNWTCHQCTSFASHGLLGGLQLPLRLADGLPDVLHHEDAGGELLMWALLVRLRRQVLPHNRHTPTLQPEPSCLGGRQGWISQLNLWNVFLSCISVFPHRHRHIHTPWPAASGQACLDFSPLLSFHRSAQIYSDTKKQRLFIPDMCFLFCPLKGKKT